MREHRVLRPEPELVREARDLVGRLCADINLPDDVRDTAVLLASETVTNAIVHGRTEVHVVADVTAERIRVEVADRSSRQPQPTHADITASSGRGLTLLDLLASAWGVDKQLVGKTVWFELRVA